MMLSTWIVSCFLIHHRLEPKTQHILALENDLDVRQQPHPILMLEENTGRDQHAAEDDPMEKGNTLNKIHQHMISMNLLTKTKQWLKRHPLLLHPESLLEPNPLRIHAVNPHLINPGSGDLWEKYQQDGDWYIIDI